jgi:dihydroorotase
MGLKPAEALAGVTHRAAKILGVDAGTIAAGAAADICLFDPKRPWVVEPSALASQGKNTPFQGLELTGRVMRTLVGGRTVYAA